MSVTRVHIAAGTANPAKLEAIRRAAEEILGDVPVESVEVDPDVPVQPWGDEETAHGALMRARNALAASPDATFAVGVESGLTDWTGRPHLRPLLGGSDRSIRSGRLWRQRALPGSRRSRGGASLRC